jgi:hypothetical protein
LPISLKRSSPKRVWGNVVAYLLAADKYSRPFASRLIGVGQPVIGTQNVFAALHPIQLADI